MIFEEAPEFTEKALSLIGNEEIFAIQMFLMEQPDAGDVIPGSGCCRKLRLAAKSHEKRGVGDLLLDHRILLLDLYAKNKSESLNTTQLKELKRRKS